MKKNSLLFSLTTSVLLILITGCSTIPKNKSDLLSHKDFNRQTLQVKGDYKTLFSKTLTMTKKCWEDNSQPGHITYIESITDNKTLSIEVKANNLILGPGYYFFAEFKPNKSSTQIVMNSYNRSRFAKDIIKWLIDKNLKCSFF